MRAAVIGGGVVGCSIGLELGKRGHEVTVFDKNGEVGHGSTSASCAIVRRFYSQPGMVAMAHEASFLWDDWGSFLGPIEEEKAVFHRPGMLYIPPRMDDSVHGIVDEMRKVGIEVSVLSAEDLAARFPYLDSHSQFPPRVPSDPEFFESTAPAIEGAVFEVGAGYVVSPGLATHNLRLAGEREGVRFRLNSELASVAKSDSGGFHLRFTDGSSLETDVLVNAAGPHSAMINRMVGAVLPLETRALRREVHALKNPEYNPQDGSSLPVVGDLNSGVYFRPEAGGRDLIVGSTDPECDELEWVEDPDSLDVDPTEKYRERQCLRLMKRFPEVGLGPPRGLAALYDVTVKDWYPIVDRTDVGGYYVCIGTSGSSFKTAPVLGILMAEIVEACEGGRDTDIRPVQLELPHVGVTVDTTFLSRSRGAMQTTGTVIG